MMPFTLTSNGVDSFEFVLNGNKIEGIIGGKVEFADGTEPALMIIKKLGDGKIGIITFEEEEK